MRKMKEWPPKDEPAYFGDIVDPIVKALRFAYSMRRRNRNKDVPYGGLEIGRKQQACCLLAAKSLQAEQLKYSLEDQGRDAAQEIVGLAVRLGIEQGRRIAKCGSAEALTIKTAYLVASAEGGDHEARLANIAQLLKFLTEEDE